MPRPVCFRRKPAPCVMRKARMRVKVDANDARVAHRKCGHRPRQSSGGGVGEQQRAKRNYYGCRDAPRPPLHTARSPIRDRGREQDSRERDSNMLSQREQPDRVEQSRERREQYVPGWKHELCTRGNRAGDRIAECRKGQQRPRDHGHGGDARQYQPPIRARAHLARRVMVFGIRPIRFARVRHPGEMYTSYARQLSNAGTLPLWACALQVTLRSTYARRA